MITNLNIGDMVRQAAKGEGDKRVGKVIEIDTYTNQVRVQWENNRTWITTTRLVRV